MGKEREREGRGGSIVLQKQAEPGIIIGMIWDSQLSYPKEGRVAEFPYSVVFLRIIITIEKNQLRTYRTHKTFWVPMGTQSRNIAISYGLATPSTSRRKQRKVIITTIRLPISLMKATFTKWPSTSRTHKMFRMPRLV